MVERFKSILRLATSAWGGTATQDHHANVMAQAEQAGTALWGAIDAGNTAVVMDKLDEADRAAAAPVADEKKRPPHLADQRDPVGANIVHRAYLHGKKDLARALLQRYPHLIKDFYTEPFYFGENALHMAVANEDIVEARFLAQLCPDLIHGHATGIFFDRDKTEEGTIGDTDGVINSTYYGETPLGFAVSTAQAEMVTFLVMECNAKISEADTHGNTAAHMAVIHSRIEVYNLLNKLWEAGFGRPPEQATTPLGSLRNRQGLTPVAMAASLGKTEVFEALWQPVVEWSWSDVTSNLYPLDLVESTGDLLRRESELKRKTESGSAATSASKKLVEDASAAAPTGNKAQEDSGLWSRVRAGVRTALVGRDWQWEEAPSALSAAVEHEQRDILTLPRVKGLLDKKWRKFAYRRFINTFISSGVFVALFTVAVIMRTELGRNTASFRSSCGASTPAMVVAENTTLNCTVGLDALPAPLGSAIGNAVDAVAAVSPFNITRLNILPFDRTNFDPAEIFRYPWLCGRELFWECAITTLLELVVLVGAVWRLLGDLRRAARIGFREYFKLRGAGTLLNVPPVTGCACILIGFALDLLDGNYDGVLHRMFLSLAALSMYAYCTSFLLAFVQTGPFVVSFVYMIGRDMVRFFYVVILFVLGATLAFFIQEYPDSEERGFMLYRNILHKVVKEMLSPGLEHGQDVLQKVAYVIYVLVASVTLLNTLIAMLGDTYSKFGEEAEQQYQLERARIILNIEQNMSLEERLAAKYWVVKPNLNRPFLMLEEQDAGKFTNDTRKQSALDEMKRVDDKLAERKAAGAAAAPALPVVVPLPSSSAAAGTGLPPAAASESSAEEGPAASSGAGAHPRRYPRQRAAAPLLALTAPAQEEDDGGGSSVAADTAAAPRVRRRRLSTAR